VDPTRDDFEGLIKNLVSCRRIAVRFTRDIRVHAMTDFKPDDSGVWWSNQAAAALVGGYHLLFASANPYEAYLFALMCKNDGIAPLLGSATTEQEAIDLITPSSPHKLLCLLVDNIAPDCGVAIAALVQQLNAESRAVLIVTNIEKLHALAPNPQLFHALCSITSVGRGGLTRCLQALASSADPYIDPALQQGLQELKQSGAPILTAREREILGFVAAGFTNKQIAHQVFIAETTVRDYVSTILIKIGVANRAAAAAWAMRHGLLPD